MVSPVRSIGPRGFWARDPAGEHRAGR